MSFIKFFTFTILFMLSASSHALKLRVMTFNTMCDFCNGSHFFGYKTRLDDIKAVIKKYQPDLISLQEIRLASQIRYILEDFSEYRYVTNEGDWFSYADPTIIYNKNKFHKKEKGHFWLGPNHGEFTLGWKWALPRQIVYVKLEDAQDQFLFIGTHFDNRLENLKGSAIMTHEFLDKNASEKIIFAGDTYITIDMPEYKNLLQGLMINAFSKKKSFQVDGEYSTDKDLCYTRKGKTFPECRVDHILLSSNHDWKVHNYIISTNKRINNSKEFPSDHRAVIVDLEL